MVNTLPSLSLNHAARPTGVTAMPIHRGQIRPVILLEAHASLAELGHLCRQIIDSPGGKLVLDSSRFIEKNNRSD